MLPTLSRLSVSVGPESRLHRWCSSRSLRISPLHREFRPPIPNSSHVVSNALPWLSQGISHSTYITTYTPFTPSESEQRSPPTYYRGCWHVVGRGFLQWYRRFYRLLTDKNSSHSTAVYDPKAFILHAASHRQGFPHCERFSTAASRRSLGSVSVPVWLTILSDQLPVLALVGHYPTN